MQTIRIHLEYKCYPVWIYDEEGLVEDTALPPELANDYELSEKFRSLQERFDATYVDTLTDFHSEGFKSSEEEAAFKFDLKAAAIELMEKCPANYSIEISRSLVE